MTNCPQTPVETLEVFADVHYVCETKFHFLQLDLYLQLQTKHVQMCHI